ncbi:MAG: DHHA1 domain-containing protein, partial [Campylobacterota bacterium]|nr:DHHA1 domain-containing protein [Campylobacterota bacterium]
SLAKYRILPKILDTLELHFEGKFATVYLEPKWLDETGATLTESDDVVDMILKISIVEAVGYIRDKKGKARVSLRSKDDLDVSIIAQEFNGGGHKNAAGLTIDTSNIQEAKDNLLKSVKKYF